MTEQHNQIVGTILADRYEILARLGSGGMAVVYKGRHRLLNRIVAIKMLSSTLEDDDKAIKRFQQEAQAASYLSHPNLMTVFDFGISTDGQPYLVSEFVQGESLCDIIDNTGHIPTEVCLPMFLQTCSALAHAHLKGVLHRDLKPSNMMIAQTEEHSRLVKIVDFGIATFLPEAKLSQEKLTHAGEFFGTAEYVSPEQCRGKALDARSDIYSMGCVMYETLTGLPPFMGENTLATIQMHIKDPPPRFADVRPDLEIPAELEAVVFKALAKQPDQRQQSMEQLRQELESIRLTARPADEFDALNAATDSSSRASSTTSTARMPTSGALNIFIVEDHEMIRLGLKAGLERIDGFSIVGEAENGLEGVQMVRAQKPDVVLMDIELPELDGIQATQRIKSEFPDMRIIMLTSQREDEGVFAAFAAGADGYCLKGAPIDRLASAIRTVAEGAAWLDPAIAGTILREPAPSPGPVTASQAKDTEKVLAKLEQDVLQLVADGLSNPEIAQRLYLSAEKVRSHLRGIMDKLVTDERTQSAAQAFPSELP